jgi:GNAT superfamily N-acetyltransferase
VPVLVRPMLEADVGAVEALGHRAFAVDANGPDRDAEMEAWGLARTAHFLATDPGGNFVADDDGEIVGVGQSLRREGLWGLALLAVRSDRHGEGLGRRLIDACLEYGRDALGGMILSTEHPAAMRLYASSGFALRPTVSAGGIVDRDALRPGPDVRPGTAADYGWMDDVSRLLRGAGHSRDVAQAVEAGTRLLAIEDRGWALVRREEIRCLAARDAEAATQLLDAGLATMPRGATASVDSIAAGNDWAIQTCLRAGLALSPSGPIFTRGTLGTLAPYLPSGPYL